MTFPETRSEKALRKVTFHISELVKTLQELERIIKEQEIFFAIEPTYPQNIRRNITTIKNYEAVYERSDYRPVNFLRLLKRFPYSRIAKKFGELESHKLEIKVSAFYGGNKKHKFSNHFPLSKICQTFPLKLDLDRVIECLIEVQTRREHAKEVNSLERDYTLSFEVPGLKNCLDISFVQPDRVCVIDGRTLLLTDTKGEKFHEVDDIFSSTVNKSGIFYIDGNFNIQKFSYLTNKSVMYIEQIPWIPRSLYCCPGNDDLLVGMTTPCARPFQAKIVRYNTSGEITQIIHNDDRGRALYRYPLYITENNNGDIVVSDCRKRGIVVTNREGKRRFFLPVKKPRGICIDLFSNILVCRYKEEILRFDKDGQTITILKLTELPAQDKPLCLGFDISKALLFVGANYCNRISVYRYQEGESVDDDLRPQREVHRRWCYLRSYCNNLIDACIHKSLSPFRWLIGQNKYLDPVPDEYCSVFKTLFQIFFVMFCYIFYYILCIVYMNNVTQPHLRHSDIRLGKRCYDDPFGFHVIYSFLGVFILFGLFRLYVYFKS